jgi:hypothetical protein
MCVCVWGICVFVCVCAVPGAERRDSDINIDPAAEVQVVYGFDHLMIVCVHLSCLASPHPPTPPSPFPPLSLHARVSIGPTHTHTYTHAHTHTDKDIVTQ